MSDKVFFGGLYDSINNEEEEVEESNESILKNKQSTSINNSPTTNNTNTNQKQPQQQKDKTPSPSITGIGGVKIPPKLLQAQALRNKVALQKKQQQSFKTSNTINNKENSSSAQILQQQQINQQLQQQQPQINNNNVSDILFNDFQTDENIMNEYDPFIPNDYDKILKEKERIERERLNKHQFLQQQQQPTHQQRIINITEENKNEICNQYSKAPTKILLLLNIVNREEIDKELEDDMLEECKKFGKVNKVVIHPITNQEQVRIFIYFDSTDSTKSAFNQMNNRYFAQKRVEAHFYKENLFFKNKLDP